MELLKDYIGTVEFPIPTEVVSANFSVFRGETQIGIPTAATISSGVAKCVLPYAAVAESGQVRVELTFSVQSQSYTKKTTVDVVTPILPLHEIQQIIEVATLAETLPIEKAVRNIINAHCGQEFNSFIGVKTIHGRGDPFLSLPVHLESVNTINGQSMVGHYIQHNGFMLMPSNPSEVAWSNNTFVSGSPIKTPKNSAGYFALNYAYKIDGVWGWSEVPEEVKEAARLLINDYSCGDSAYRDRFLQSMTAADWRIQFNSGAYINTGNVRANQLLDNFRVTRIAVI